MNISVHPKIYHVLFDGHENNSILLNRDESPSQCEKDEYVISMHVSESALKIASVAASKAESVASVKKVPAAKVGVF